jgi:hypothetical protein
MFQSINPVRRQNLTGLKRIKTTFSPNLTFKKKSKIGSPPIPSGFKTLTGLILVSKKSFFVLAKQAKKSLFVGMFWLVYIL